MECSLLFEVMYYAVAVIHSIEVDLHLSMIVSGIVTYMVLSIDNIHLSSYFV